MILHTCRSIMLISVHSRMFKLSSDLVIPTLCYFKAKNTLSGSTPVSVLMTKSVLVLFSITDCA